MKPQTGAVQVLERTSNYLKSGVLKKQPAWFNVVGQNPPNKSFLREPKKLKIKQSIELNKSQPLKNPNAPLYKTKSKQTSGRNIYKPQKLNFVEDELRSLFFEQHPWELSRPKILLENSGDESTKTDWSSIRQVNTPLDGESVVQRTIYLLNEENSEHTLESAYDQARFELYRVRIEEEIQQQVSEEENKMFGAVYAPRALEHGAQKEQEFIDDWKIKASEATEILKSRNSGPLTQGQESEVEELGDELEDAIEK